jgi:hypothetical protein
MQNALPSLRHGLFSLKARWIRKVLNSMDLGDDRGVESWVVGDGKRHFRAAERAHVGQ